MNNTNKSLFVLGMGLLLIIITMVWKNLTGDINIELTQLKQYAAILSVFPFVSGIFANIAIKKGEEGIPSVLLAINIILFVVTFWIGVIGTLLNVPFPG